MSFKPEIGRLRFVTWLLVALFMVLAWRLVDLQVLRHDDLAKEARNNTVYSCKLEPRRGDILDCNSNLLATSVFVKTVCANPSLIAGHLSEVIPILSPLLQMDEAELTQKLQPKLMLNKDKQVITNRFGQPLTNQYVLLKRKVPADVWERLNIYMTNIPMPGVEKKKEGRSPAPIRNAYNALRYKAIFTETPDEQIRVYPNGSLAAHVLGYVGTGIDTNGSSPVNILVGQDGIERRLNEKLFGVRGWRVTERDHQQREILDKRQQNVEARDGLNAVLTIDSVIQHILETALEDGMKRSSPTSISGIVVRPKTGEILAMATLPTYDPNRPGDYDEESRRDRIVTDVHEPGSTFKIVVVAGALNDHTVKLTDVFDCMHGSFEYAGKVLHDHVPLDNLTVEQIITKSSNIGAAKIGLLMGQQRLYDHIREFGFGASTGLLPGERNGIVFPPDGWPATSKYPGYGKWSKLSITRIPMGQEFAVTSIQMVMAMCAIGNKGILMEPMLVDRLLTPDGEVAVQNHPKIAWRAVSEEAARDTVTALKSVVMTDGTAVAAGMTNYTVAGKTGTAQKLDEKNGGYMLNHYYASFIGFFPADNPEICIYVSLDDPKGGHTGGLAAAPIFHAIAEKAANYLNIRPDKGNPSGIPLAPAVQVGQPLRSQATIMPGIAR